MPLIDPDDVKKSFVLFEHRPAGEVPWHAHRSAQLVYVNKGVIRVQTEQGLWVIPPERAVWVLPNARHAVSASLPYSLCTLYVKPKRIPLPATCKAIAISSLVRELLLAAAQFGTNYKKGAVEEKIIDLLLCQLGAHTSLPMKGLFLPEPRDERLRRITNWVKNDPTENHSLAMMVKEAGTTERTVARLFQRELGMTFGRWCLQYRILTALDRLARGESVTDVAHKVGFTEASSFISMFKRSMGESPLHYIRQMS